MGAEKRRRFQPDPRTWLLLCLLGIAAILVIRSEIGCLCLFLACLLIHMLAGNGGKILPYGLYYLIFYGIGWLGVHLMDSGVAFSVSSMLSSIGIVSRKVLVPLYLKGWNPIWVGLAITLFLTILIIALVYGFDRRCWAAVSAMQNAVSAHAIPAMWRPCKSNR